MRKELLVALAVVLAGCSVPSLGGSNHPETPTGGDAIGYESGYWYDDPVSVTTGDGLNETERAAVVARTMARVERVRGLEFKQSVPVSVISRAEYRNRSRGDGSGGSGRPQDPWNDQVWEALLIIGEDSGSSESIGDTLSTTVQGYYSPSRDEIVIVSPTETPQIDRRTLSHELVHALQDQHFGLNGSAKTQDTQLSRQGVTEGEANYVRVLYERRCGDGWGCIALPDRTSDGGESSDGGSQEPSYNEGLFTVLYQPYVTGPRFIDQVRADGGWGAVDALHDDFPDSTEQVLHPEKYPDEKPVNVSVADRSTDEWSRFDHDPVGDTVGETSVYAMMYHNGQTEGDRYSYESDISAGWGGDLVVPYRNGSGGYGYVWETRWDTEEDATEFEQAYRAALTEEHDASQPRHNVYVVPEDDQFNDAFRVVRSGKTVRIVNGPKSGDLDDIHRQAGS
ncbi:Hvo_1808 family surface protein [Haloarcula sp. 1CSR25-25]|uniref:Hvo_1808 family surface protein n=1 Tax=Haloarcula sp. 1CSR25-25 TaxID=2862545 RepID=UPI0028960FD4|nr:Hvo_1808 family surface protein [Haloarcula sp. 1CSR25-25]MDT3433610.1 Hvo_1808 family surface protein [Haloarcula sp. 1CSR25-25]